MIHISNSVQNKKKKKECIIIEAAVEWLFHEELLSVNEHTDNIKASCQMSV